MALPISADEFTLGPTGPNWRAVAVAPNTGGGVAAPLGSFAILTTTGTWWRKFGAGNTDWISVEAPTADFVYTATGAEGTAFDVTIPAPYTPQPSALFYPTYILEDVVNHVTMSFPNTAGARTTLKFSVVLSGALTLNDTIRFTLRPIS